MILDLVLEGSLNRKNRPPPREELFLGVVERQRRKLPPLKVSQLANSSQTGNLFSGIP